MQLLVLVVLVCLAVGAVALGGEKILDRLRGAKAKVLEEVKKVEGEVKSKL
jgi:hypothetical protein